MSTVVLWQRPAWRDELWAKLSDAEMRWDMIVIGGGITGAGILQQAARAGLNVLLVEQRDFAWGTSSRSSKFVHGGLRYLRDGDVHLTWESVRERDKLVQSGAGLVEEIGFLIASYEGERPGPLTYRLALTVYDLIGGKMAHRRYKAGEFQMLAPHLDKEGLRGGFRYGDAQTDDARLTLRVLHEGIVSGGVAVNYMSVEGLLLENGTVTGVQLFDHVQQRRTDVRARVVINATGAWVDRLRGEVNAPARIRPLRGSHIVFSGWRAPLAQAITFLHPFDRRPLTTFPWESVTVIGTTDVDHDAPLDQEAAISPAETAYLMAAMNYRFPELKLTLEDVIAAWAGVRPVIDTGKADPSRESRDHAIWEEQGLLTVTGGKLTTFRVMARDVLRVARKRLPELAALDDTALPLQLTHIDLPHTLQDTVRQRLLGRYAEQAADLVGAAQTDELEPIPGTPVLWVELRWAAHAEAVVHLEDLLLRRTRLGVLLPEGGASHLPRIRQICQAELGWDDARWEVEEAAYRALVQTHYSLPPRNTIPDWQAQLATVLEKRAQARQQRHSRRRKQFGLLSGAIFASILALRRVRRP
jgi:glycerol-3-phosphate dehydrogenase